LDARYRVLVAAVGRACVVVPAGARAAVAQIKSLLAFVRVLLKTHNFRVFAVVNFVQVRSATVAMCRHFVWFCCCFVVLRKVVQL
jgi:hypothetical protein